MNNLSTYIGVFLDQQSKDLIVKHFASYVPEGWGWFNDHLTIQYFGKPIKPSEFPSPYDKWAEANQTVQLTITHIGISDQAVAVKVIPPSFIKIAMPHITLATHNGKNPIVAKYITNWQEVPSIKVSGVIAGNSDAPELVSESIEEYNFNMGDCDIYAIAMHRVFQYPLYAVRGFYHDEDNELMYEDCHIVVKSPSGKYLDASGEHTFENLRKRAYFDNKIEKIKMTPISEEEAASTFSCMDQEKDIEYVMNKLKHKKQIEEEDIVSDTLVPFTGRREDSLDGSDPNEQAWAAPTMHVKMGNMEETVGNLTTKILSELTTTFPFNVGTAEATYDSWTDRMGDKNKDGENLALAAAQMELNEIEYADISKLPFLSAIEKIGGKVYQIGGSLRDEFLGKQSKDLDITVCGLTVEQLLNALSPYGKANLVGQSFGVIKFKPHGAKEDIDIALCRSDKKVSAGHKGIQVNTDPSITINDDLIRRDISINSIAKDIHGNIIDPFNGLNDIKNKIIRMTSPEAFADDPLRMIRAISFAARFNFTIEPNTFNTIRRHAADIKSISAERILEEFNKIIYKSDNSEIGAKLLVDSGLYKYIFNTDYKGNYANFDKVKRMSEFIYLLTKDSLPFPSEFFKKNLKGDIDTFKEIRVFELPPPHDATSERWLLNKAHNIAPNAIGSFIIQDRIKDTSKHPEDKYPRVASKIAVSSDEIKSFGIKGMGYGKLNTDLLNLIYNDQLPNEHDAILNYIQQNQDKYKSNTENLVKEITEKILTEFEYDDDPNGVYNYQDKYPERLVHSDWKGNSGVWRFKIENAGDILRELGKYKNTFLDPGYIFEKVNYIEGFIKTYIDQSRIHPYQRYITFKRNNPELLQQIRAAYEKQPVVSEAQKVALELIFNIIDGNLAAAQKQIDYFNQFRGKRKELMLANKYPNQEKENIFEFMSAIYGAEHTDEYQEIAYIILDKLLESNINAFVSTVASTGSVYLQFYDRRLGKIRVSNHPPKDSDAVFNVSPKIKTFRREFKNNKYYYYFGVAYIDKLISVIKIMTNKLKQKDENQSLGTEDLVKEITEKILSEGAIHNPSNFHVTFEDIKYFERNGQKYFKEWTGYGEILLPYIGWKPINRGTRKPVFTWIIGRKVFTIDVRDYMLLMFNKAKHTTLLPYPIEEPKRPEENNNALLREFSDADALRLEKAALQYYGEAHDYKVAAYITPNGYLLDFSEGRGSREQDHRNIEFLFDELNIDKEKYGTKEWETSHSGGMYAVMDMGFIRYMPEANMIEMHQMPYQEQFKVLRDIIRREDGAVTVEVFKEGTTSSAMEYEKGTPVDYIITGIKNYYREGMLLQPYGYIDDEDLYESVILEGKYDKITGEVTKKIFEYLKATKTLYDKGEESKIGQKEADGFYEEIVGEYQEPLKFDLVIRHKRDETIEGEFAINGATYDKIKTRNNEYIALLEIELTLNPKYEPEIYNSLNSTIQDTVRHELEHLTQGGVNLKTGKDLRTAQSTRRKIHSHIGSAYKYFTLRDEIPAIVNGLYRKAKMDKRPLKDEMEEYAQYWYDKGNITEYEKYWILKKWTHYAQEHLPAAQLTETRIKKQDLINLVMETNKSNKIWRLVIFDMDGTLINSPDPTFGKPEWEKKRGEEFPHNKGWWSKPESLDVSVFDINAIPPVFNQMRDEQKRSDTMVVIMTNRLNTLEQEVKQVLKQNRINPDLLSMAEYSQQNKGDRVLQLLQKNQDIKYVAFYDDDETNILNVRNALKGKGITYDMYNCQDGKIRKT